jgi:hypothetical protein
MTLAHGDDTQGGAAVSAARLLLLSGDLMLSSQLEAPARAVGLSLAVAPSSEVLSQMLAAEAPALVVIDLADHAFAADATCGLVRERAPRACILAFYPHVRPELGKNGEAAGCDLVIPRSRFFTRTADVFREALESGAFK